MYMYKMNMQTLRQINDKLPTHARSIPTNVIHELETRSQFDKYSFLEHWNFKQIPTEIPVIAK